MHRKPTNFDIQTLVQYLRPMDVVEAHKWGYGDCIQKGIETSIKNSFKTKAITHNNILLGIAGLIRTQEKDTLRVWFLGTVFMDFYPKEFIRTMKSHMKKNPENARFWDVIIYKKQQKYIRFLSRLGFIFEPYNDAFLYGIKQIR